MTETKIVEMVSVKFIREIEMNIEDSDGQLVRRSFGEGQIAELPKDIALRLFKEGKILPGPQHGAAVSNIFEGGNQK